MNAAWEQVAVIIESIPPLVLAAALLGVGVTFLLFGWHIYRIALVSVGVLNGAAIGAGIAFALNAGFSIRIPVIVLAVPIGVLVGLVALRLEKVGAFFVGGLCGAIPLLGLRHFFEAGYGLYAAAGIAFVLCGILAIFLWRPMIIISLSVIGAYCLANAAVLATDRLETFNLRELAAAHPYGAATATGILTAIGVLFQTREEKGESETADDG